MLYTTLLSGIFNGMLVYMVEVGKQSQGLELPGEILSFDVLSMLKPTAKASFVLNAFPTDCY